MLKNFNRIQDVQYRPESIFAADKAGWPADWEGRTLLGLVLLSRTTGAYPAYLDSIMEVLKERLKENGYLGKVCPTNTAMEQQLSGHNWLLRALLELYLWKKDEQVKNMATRMVETLYLPVKNLYYTYPTNPEKRTMKGEMAGTNDGTCISSWFTSSDIGCAYMSLDALSQYYELFRDERVKNLLDVMFETFQKIDFVKASMQTHASLSAIRGILRYYRTTEKQELLDFSVNFWELYCHSGMTENYANYNWFHRSNTWTEPCAIVDSYLVAVELFQITKTISYLTQSHRILFNGLYYAQRENGGFGCDNCVGVGEEPLVLKVQGYEAFWCCSMRGAEGLAKVALYAVQKNEKKIFVTNYFDGTYRVGEVALEVKTQYPYEGDTRIQVSGLMKPVDLQLYIPPETEEKSIVLTSAGIPISFVSYNGFIEFTLDIACTLELKYKVKLEIKDTVADGTEKGHKVLWHGNLILGTVIKENNILSLDNVRKLTYEEYGIYMNGEQKFSPIMNTIYVNKDEYLKQKTQILF